MTLLITSQSDAVTLSKDQLKLKNYGFSHCLSYSDDTSLKFEAGKAKCGYFQLGNHGVKVYPNVTAYIDKEIKKQTGMY